MGVPGLVFCLVGEVIGGCRVCLVVGFISPLRFWYMDMQF